MLNMRKSLKNKVNITIYYNNKKRTTQFILNQKIIFNYYDCLVIINPGFISDGMSVPKCLWSLISPKIDARTLLPSIKHDFLFECKLGFFKSNWYYFKDLKDNLNLFKRILILFRVNFISVGHIIIFNKKYKVDNLVIYLLFNFNRNKI